MSNLMVSISGLRGIVGETLTPRTITRFTSAFAYLSGNGTIVLGRDSRPSGLFISHLVKGTLLSLGCEVVDLGIVPTPTVQLMTEKLGANGGMIVTASHNPVQWNGLKFVGEDGMFLAPDKAQEMFAIADSEIYNPVAVDKLGQSVENFEAMDIHINKVLNLGFIDPQLIKKKKFKVAFDPVNGASAVIISKLLERLGCAVEAINTETHGFFAHTPEPVPENLSDLSELVKKVGADVGFAIDPDGDRCALLDENGNPLSEEYTITLATKFILSKRMGNVVVNMSTTRAVEDIARYYNCPFFRTPVGEIHVAKLMQEKGAAIGGEGNGGVILPDVHLGRDSLVAVAIVLQFMAESGISLSEMKAQLPQYSIAKHKINIEGLDPDKIFAHFRQVYNQAEINDLDGLKLDFEAHWLHLRKSNTEPIIRIIAEAKSLDKAEQICMEAMTEIKSQL
jgi:phosphomannomutase